MPAIWVDKIRIAGSSFSAMSQIGIRLRVATDRAAAFGERHKSAMRGLLFRAQAVIGQAISQFAISNERRFMGSNGFRAATKNRIRNKMGKIHVQVFGSTALAVSQYAWASMKQIVEHMQETEAEIVTQLLAGLEGKATGITGRELTRLLTRSVDGRTLSDSISMIMQRTSDEVMAGMIVSAGSAKESFEWAFKSRMSADRAFKGAAIALDREFDRFAAKAIQHEKTAFVVKAFTMQQKRRRAGGS